MGTPSSASLPGELSAQPATPTRARTNARARTPLLPRRMRARSLSSDAGDTITTGDLDPGHLRTALDQVPHARQRLRPAPAPPALPARLPDPVEDRRRHGPEGQPDSRRRPRLELPDQMYRAVVQPPAACMLDDLVGAIGLRDHRLHVADPRRGVDPETRRGAAAGGGDALHSVVAGEVIDPARAGRQVADEVEDALARGVDGCGHGDRPHGRAILEARAPPLPHRQHTDRPQTMPGKSWTFRTR